MSRRDELAGAFMLLTRLPVGRFARAEAPPAACVWAYPLAGGAVGAIGAAVFAAARLGLPPAIAAILAVGAMVLATGGLHEDGLADTADGFGGGQSRERKLAIMRDSRIGSFGALALMLALALRVAALASLAGPRPAAAALVAAGALGRGAMLVALWRLVPARPDGLAAALAGASPGAIFTGLALAAGCAIGAPAEWAAALAAAVVMAVVSQRVVGGYTGDILGATEQVAECAVLVTAVFG